MKIMQVDKNYFRPQEVDYLKGNSQKSRRKLKWKPKTSLSELIIEMMTQDYKFYKDSIS
jgi:GDPmannose 4,6-dehydratase